MLLPGPEALQLATYIGWLMHRTLGGLVAGGLFVLSSLVILIVLSWVYMVFGNAPVIAGVLYGIKPAVTAIVLFAAYRIGSRAVKSAVLWGIAAAPLLFGPDQQFLGAVLAACAVTYFTFLPSFVFIFLGGPLAETTHRQPRVIAPLTAITAAVVGVILNLAAFFAYHVLWPDALRGAFEWPLLLLGLAAGVALFRYRVGVIPTILGCGAAGLLYQTLVRPLFH